MREHKAFGVWADKWLVKHKLAVIVSVHKSLRYVELTEE